MVLSDPIKGIVTETLSLDRNMRNVTGKLVFDGKNIGRKVFLISDLIRFVC